MPSSAYDEQNYITLSYNLDACIQYNYITNMLIFGELNRYIYQTYFLSLTV